MRSRMSRFVSIAAIAAFLVLAVTLPAGRGAEALVLIAVVAVLAGMYMLRRYARATLIYHRDAEPSSSDPDREPVDSSRRPS